MEEIILKARNYEHGFMKKLDEAIFKWFLSAKDVEIGGVVFKQRHWNMLKRLG